SIEIVEARDNQAEGLVFVTIDQISAEPDRFQAVRLVKASGALLTLDAKSAVDLGVARKSSESLNAWIAANGLKGIRVDEPTWVDALVATLNTPWMSWLLL